MCEFKVDMNITKCPNCQNAFDGEKYPVCPSCLGVTWSNYLGFVRLKHDPYKLPLSMNQYRSVLSCDVVDDLSRFTEFLAKYGKWYQRTTDKAFCHFTDEPLYTIPGSAVYKGEPMPSVALYGLLVAKPESDPHAYCVDISKFKADIDTGKYMDIECCSQPSCRKLTKPGWDKCTEHLLVK